jgi:dipeptidyl-peptidase-4
LIAYASSLDAGTNRFTAELISKSEHSTNITRVMWHPSGEQVTYLRPRGASRDTTNVLCAYDIALGREMVLFAPPPATNGARLSLSNYQWSPGGDAILVEDYRDLWLVSIPQGEPRRITDDSEAEEFPTFSPDGQRVAFVKTNNLFVVEVKSGRQKQLTADGTELVLNGKLDWVYGEEFSHVVTSARAYEWSPDGRRIAFLRLDEHPIPTYPITDFLKAHPTVRSQRYPKAGDTNPVPRMCCVDVTKARSHVVIMPAATNTEYIVPEFSWAPDSMNVAVTTLNRGQNERSVLLWETSGRRAPQLLLREMDSAWINPFDPPLFPKPARSRKSPASASSEAVVPFIWLSERDGWLHAYRYDLDGAPPRQVTRGAWQIEPNFSLSSWNDHAVDVDFQNGWIYFSASNPDPRERHLWRARLDGTALERLSHEPGTHAQRLSPDGRHLLETFSSVKQPMAIRVLRADGTLVVTLDQRSDRWREFAAATTEFHEIAGPDNTKLYAQLTKPPDFDSARRYPVIVYVYGGPQAQVVRNHWPAISPRLQLLAQEGFLIWSLDNRGSSGRGHEWEKTVFRRLGTNELSDQLAGIAYLKTLPFVDTNRFGIFGWSYGGYMTLYALTHAPDVFKCGVAGAPVTDWKFYDTIYTERYMRTPAENPAGYRTSSPLAAASRSKGKVLLIHGTADDNVHMQNTMNFVDALIKANRPYELEIQPGQMHGFGGEAANRFLSEQILEFFKRNL